MSNYAANEYLPTQAFLDARTVTEAGARLQRLAALSQLKIVSVYAVFHRTDEKLIKMGFKKTWSQPVLLSSDDPDFIARQYTELKDFSHFDNLGI